MSIKIYKKYYTNDYIKLVEVKNIPIELEFSVKNAINKTIDNIVQNKPIDETVMLDSYHYCVIIDAKALAKRYVQKVIRDWLKRQNYKCDKLKIINIDKYLTFECDNQIISIKAPEEFKVLSKYI